MKLAAKLVIAFVLGILLLTSIYGYLGVQREISMLESDMEEDARQYAVSLEQMANLMNCGSVAEISQLIAEHQAAEYVLHAPHVFDVVWLTPSAESNAFPPNSKARQVNASSNADELPSHVWSDGNEEKISYFYETNFDFAPQGGFLLTASHAGVNDYISETVYRTVGLMAGMALIGGLLMALLGVTQVGRPLEQLISKTRKVASGDLTGPVVLQGFDELSELADSLNQMCVRLQKSQAELHKEAQSKIETLEQLRHADRLKTVGRLAAGMAHELGTPLSVVSGRASLISSGKLSPEDVSQSAETIKAESDRMAKTIRQLLDFARHSQPQRVTMDLRHVVRQTVDLLQPLAKKRGATINFTAPETAVEAQFDVGQIQQVLTNLIVNGLQAMPRGGEVQVLLDQTQFAPAAEGTPAGEYFRIRVIDRGEGISPEDLPQIFEPFFTTKAQGQGTGLGLSISHGIVHEHGGWIDAHSTPGEGSEFIVYLPVIPREGTPG